MIYISNKPESQIPHDHTKKPNATDLIQLSNPLPKANHLIELTKLSLENFDQYPSLKKFLRDSIFYFEHTDLSNDDNFFYKEALIAMSIIIENKKTNPNTASDEAIKALEGFLSDPANANLYTFVKFRFFLKKSIKLLWEYFDYSQKNNLLESWDQKKLLALFLDCYDENNPQKFLNSLKISNLLKLTVKIFQSNQFSVDQYSQYQSDELCAKVIFWRALSDNKKLSIWQIIENKNRVVIFNSFKSSQEQLKVEDLFNITNFNLLIFLNSISADDKNQLLKEIANTSINRFFDFQEYCLDYDQEFFIANMEHLDEESKRLFWQTSKPGIKAKIPQLYENFSEKIPTEFLIFLEERQLADFLLNINHFKKSELLDILSDNDQKKLVELCKYCFRNFYDEIFVLSCLRVYDENDLMIFWQTLDSYDVTRMWTLIYNTHDQSLAKLFLQSLSDENLCNLWRFVDTNQIIMIWDFLKNDEYIKKLLLEKSGITKLVELLTNLDENDFLDSLEFIQKSDNIYIKALVIKSFTDNNLQLFEKIFKALSIENKISLWKSFNDQENELPQLQLAILELMDSKHKEQFVDNILSSSQQLKDIFNLRNNHLKLFLSPEDIAKWYLALPEIKGNFIIKSVALNDSEQEQLIFKAQLDLIKNTLEVGIFRANKLSLGFKYTKSAEEDFSLTSSNFLFDGNGNELMTFQEITDLAKTVKDIIKNDLSDSEADLKITKMMKKIATTPESISLEINTADTEIKTSLAILLNDQGKYQKIDYHQPRLPSISSKSRSGSDISETPRPDHSEENKSEELKAQEILRNLSNKELKSILKSNQSQNFQIDNELNSSNQKNGCFTYLKKILTPSCKINLKSCLKICRRRNRELS